MRQASILVSTLGALSTLTRDTPLPAFVRVQMALLVLLPAAAPAGFIAAQFRLGAFEGLVVHQVEALQAHIVDGGLLRLGDLLARLFDFAAQALQLLARRGREQGAVLFLD